MRAKKFFYSLEVFIVFSSLTIYVWYTMESADQQRQFQTAEISANQLTNAIESFVNEKISILLQVRNFWLNSQSVTHEKFLSFCREIISQIPGFQAIEYGDITNKVIWIEPFVSHEPLDQFNAAFEPVRRAALQRAMEKRSVTITPTLDLLQGGKGFIAIVPIFRKGRYQGAIFGVFKIDTLFSLIFDSILKQRYNCAVYDGNNLIYGTESAAQRNWMKYPVYVNKTVVVRDYSWNLILWPREYGTQRSYLGIAVLILGLTLSFVLSSLVWVLSSKAEQADLFAALLEVSHALGASADLNHVFRVTADTCLRMTRVDRCGIFLWNESEKQFEPAWGLSDRDEDVQRFSSLKLKYGDMPIVDQIIDKKRGVVVSQASAMSGIGPSLVKVFDIQSLFIVPLLFKGNLIGAMTLDRIGKKHRFSAREQSLIEAIASQAATAVKNAELLAERKKQSELIARKSKELESLLMIVSRNLKNPLRSLEGVASLLKDECSQQLAESGQHYLTRIQANIGHMESVVNALLELSRIGQIETQTESIDVNEILQEVLMNFREETDLLNVRVINHNRIDRLCYNRHGLKHIFTHLIDNAIKFSAYQKNAQVIVGSEEDGKQFRFWVKDNGIGIDEKDHERIFDLFYRSGELKDVERTGVGLAIVQRVLNRYGGNVWLESEKGKGTTMYFSIPKKTEVRKN